MTSKTNKNYSEYIPRQAKIAISVTKAIMLIGCPVLIFMAIFPHLFTLDMVITFLRAIFLASAFLTILISIDDAQSSWIKIKTENA